MNCLQYSVIFLTFFTTAISRAQGEAKAPDRIDLSSFPGQIVKDVVIPIPAEVFAVLDKVGEPDWESGIIHVESEVGVKDRGFLAMSFGSLVAEGFIAVQAQSPEDIQKIGRRSLVLAEALGLENAVKQHSLTVIDSAKENQWQVVRNELDKTQQTVRETMNQQRDQQMAGLVSLGGWLRGTNVLTGLIAADYSVDKAELLNQPDLVLHFREMVAGLKGPIKTSREMTEIETGLGRIDALMRENDRFSVEVVKQLHKITLGMLEQFYFDGPGN
ncbi:MAG: hypothetical protein P1V20_10775 [Verrucomicrobiales bacterium]|nr:hypothetical protein [Verrucomicrobiales bacterium]